jgi:acetolactate synthase-1/2/3 large subunit
MTTQSYDLFETPDGIADRLIHIHAGGEELGRVYRPRLAVTASAGAAMTAIAAAADRRSGPRRQGWVAERRAAYEAWSTPVMSAAM